MNGFLKCACPHCGQAIEYPAEGTGQTVPCPTCGKPVTLAPVNQSQPATEKQKEKLHWFGCAFDEGITKRQASDTLDKCVREFPEKDRAYYNRPATEEQLVKLRVKADGSLTYGKAKELIWQSQMAKRHSDRLNDLKENRITLLVDRLVYYRGDFCPHLTRGRVKKAARALDKIAPEWMEDENREDLLLKKVAKLNPEWSEKEGWLQT